MHTPGLKSFPHYQNRTIGKHTVNIKHKSGYIFKRKQYIHARDPSWDGFILNKNAMLQI
jgi:hypothetical protein